MTEANLKAWALRNGIQANMETMSQAEKALLRYNYVLSQSGEVMGDFTRTANTWHNVMTSIKNKLVDLQVLIGNIGVNLLKPMMINFRDALDVVNSFVEKVLNSLGVIFGWKVTMESGLGSGSNSADEYAESIDGATGSVKKLNKQLQGFHELNVISTNDGGKGGGVASGFDGYDDALAESKIILETTESLFESEWNTLYKLGKGIGDSIAKGLKDINWDNVYASASGFGTGLANFLNGLFTSKMFEVVGVTIGKSLNSALIATNAFAITYDWLKVSDTVKKGIVNALTTIDWTLAQNTFSNLGVGVANAVNGLFTNDMFSKLGTTVGQLINTGLSGIKGFVLTVDWSGIGTGVKNGVVNAVTTIRWDWANTTLAGLGKGIATFLNNSLTPDLFSAVATTLGNSINSAFTFLNTFGTTFKWDNFGKSIATGIDSFFKTTNFSLMGTTVTNIVSGIITSLTTAISTTDWKKIGQSISDLIAKIDFANLTTNLSDLASSIIKAISNLVKGVDWKELGKAIGEVIANIDFVDLAVNLGDLALSILKAIGSAITGLATENPIATAIIGVVLGIKFAGKLQGLGDSILTEIGSAIGKSETSISVPDVNSGALGTFATKLGKALGGTIAVLAAAAIGYEIGNWMYHNIPMVEKFAEDAVKIMKPVIDKAFHLEPDEETVKGAKESDKHDELKKTTHTKNYHDAYNISMMDPLTYYGKKFGSEILKARDFLVGNILKPLSEEEIYSDMMMHLTKGTLKGINLADWKKINEGFETQRDKGIETYKQEKSWSNAGKAIIPEIRAGVNGGNWESVEDVISGYSTEYSTTFSKKGWELGGKDAVNELRIGVLNGNWKGIDNDLSKEAEEGAKLYGGSSQWYQNSASIPNLMANGLNFSALRTKFANERDYESGQFVSDKWKSVASVIPSKLSNGLGSFSEFNKTIANNRDYSSGQFVTDKWKTVANCIPSKLASGLGNFSSFNNSISTNRDYSSGQFVSDKWKNVAGLIPTKLANGLGNFASFNNSIAGKRDGASSLFANNTWESDSKTIPGLIENGLNATWGKTKESMYSSFDTSGGYLVDGLKKGINDTWSSNKKGGLLSTISSLAGNLTSALKKAFGIKSPSRVWANVGYWLDMGLVKGIDEDIPTIENTISDMAYSMNNALDKAMNPMSAKLSNGLGIDDVNVVGSISKEFNASLSTTSSEQNALLRQQNELLLQILQKEGITSSDVFDAVRQQSRNYYNQTGKNALAF